jgi:hypothetical protein
MASVPSAAMRLAHGLDLGRRVGGEVVERHHRGQAELADVLDVAREVADAATDGFHILAPEVGLADAAVHLERSHRGDDDASIRGQPRQAALDVHELLGAEVGAEARFRHHHVGEVQAERRRHHAVAAMGDVREGTAVDQRGRARQRLHQVGRQRVAQEHRHGAVRLEVGRRHRRSVARRAHDDAAQPRLQVGEVAREAEGGHHLGGDHDVEAVLAGKPFATRRASPRPSAGRGRSCRARGAR